MTEFDDNGKIIFNLNALKYTKASYFEILGEKYIKITTSSPWLLEKLGKYYFLFTSASSSGTRYWLARSFI